MAQFVAFAVLLSFGLPWTYLAYRALPTEEKTLEGLLDRICLGYAISFIALFVGSQFAIWAFVPIWITGMLACLAVSIIPRVSRPRSFLPLRIGPEGKIVLVGATLYLAIRSLPLFVRDLPLGWDPYFHLILADNILKAEKAVHNWQPYENIPLNYPVGSHLLLALTSWLTHVRLHQIFEVATVLFTTLTGLQVFSLVNRSTRIPEIALYSSLAYLFSAVLGSMGYSLWGGLPNLIAMYLFLGLLTSLVADSHSAWTETAVFAGFFLSASFVHHHVMVTACGVLLWMWFYFFWIVNDRRQANRILTGMLASGILGAPYFLVYLLRIVTLGRTGIVAYNESVYSLSHIVEGMGYAFVAPVLIGAFFYFRFKKKYPVAPVLLQSLVAMLGLFVLLGYLSRAATIVLFHRDFAPFTPSRFLTDAVAGLSLFAGIFFSEMRHILDKSRRQIAAAILVGFAFNLGPYKSTFGREVSAARQQAYEWISHNTDANSVLIDSDFHSAYLSGRSSSEFPLPTSEYETLAFNREMLRAVASGGRSPDSVDRQVLFVTDQKNLRGGKVLWSHSSGLKVVELFKPSV